MGVFYLSEVIDNRSKSNKAPTDWLGSLPNPFSWSGAIEPRTQEASEGGDCPAGWGVLFRHFHFARDGEDMKLGAP